MDRATMEAHLTIMGWEAIKLRSPVAIGYWAGISNGLGWLRVVRRDGQRTPTVSVESGVWVEPVKSMAKRVSWSELCDDDLKQFVAVLDQAAARGGL